MSRQVLSRSRHHKVILIRGTRQLLIGVHNIIDVYNHWLILQHGVKVIDPDLIIFRIAFDVPCDSSKAFTVNIGGNQLIVDLWERDVDIVSYDQPMVQHQLECVLGSLSLVSGNEIKVVH